MRIRSLAFLRNGEGSRFLRNRSIQGTSQLWSNYHHCCDWNLNRRLPWTEKETYKQRKFSSSVHLAEVSYTERSPCLTSVLDIFRWWSLSSKLYVPVDVATIKLINSNTWKLSRCYIAFPHFRFIHSFIHSRIYITPLQGNYSEVLPTPARSKRTVFNWL